MPAARALALAALISSSFVAWQAAPADPAADFQAGLGKVEELVQRGSFERADQQLKDLLARHEREDCARLRKADVVELARRCAFQLGREVPKLPALLSGELVRYDAHAGDFEVRYTSKSIGDFEKIDVDREVMLQHPAFFVDTVTIEADCGSGLAAAKDGASLLVGLGTDESFEVCFGSCPASEDSEYVPAQILRWKSGGDADVVDSQEKPPPPYDKKTLLKVVVGSGGVTAYRDGKRILQAKRSARESGQVALECLDDFERLTLKGKIQPSWPQGLLDAATQAAMQKFSESWKPERELPAWIFERPSSAPRSPTISEAGAERDAGAKFATALEKVDALDGKRPLAQLEGDWKQLAAAFPKHGEAWYGLAEVQLRLGRIEAAQATCDAALAAGVPIAALESLPQMLVQVRSGPAWTRTFKNESDHYCVKSDIDAAVCAEAAKVLEESYRSYGFRLAPVPGAEKRKFVVYLFAGEAGYHEYARVALGSKPADTAGIYSPLVKQLMIWNLQDRAEMYRTVRHEGFHQYLDRLADDAPIWFDEGMACYFELADLYGGEWKEGQVDADYVGAMREKEFQWTPLPALFALSIKEFQGKGVHEHYAESWAVVHYLRQGPKDAQELFRELWTAVLAGKTPEQATAEAFSGVDVAALEAAVRRHVATLPLPR